jgi:putative transposase
MRLGYDQPSRLLPEVRRTGTSALRDTTMSTFVSNLVHFVWGTANREPLLRKSWRDRLHGYIGGVLANKKAIHENAPQSKGFEWQAGYGAFSVSKSAEPEVTAYIHNQEEHHRKWKFTAEFVALLEKHGIPYEERYLWV